MLTHAFGNRQVSVIGLGSGEFGGTCAESLARDILDTYTELGGCFLDTARVYGDFVTPKNGESEKVIGRWMTARHCRDRIFLSTKGGHPPLQDMTRSRLSREEIRRDMAESLEDLQTDHVDIYWLHRDDPRRDVGEIAETLHSLVEDGSTRMVGVSNWHPDRILEALRYARDHGLAEISANQLQFSLARPLHIADPSLVAMDADSYRMHMETRMVCCCFSSQARCFLSRLDRLGPDTPESLRRAYESPENLAILERVRTVRRETGMSVRAIALSYLTSQPFPTFALVGARSPEQLLDLKEAGDARLTQAQLDFIRKI